MGFPIFAKLSFSSPGVEANLTRVSKSFGKLRKNVKSLGTGVNNLGQGFKGLGLATAPALAGVALATKTFAGFEKQMSIVRSLTGEISEEAFAAMSAEAKRLGATTAFSAKEAAEGLQFLALAGFDTEEQIGSLESVLSLAAAGSLELGAASDIATDSLSALSPAFADPSKKVENLTALVDKFALVQSKTNTNVLQLGEAVKFGGGTLAGFGVDLNEIVASLGALADSGLKGSIGGTAVTNMFNKLLKPSSNAKKIIEELGITMTDSAGAILPIPDLMDNLIAGLDKVKGPAKRSQSAIELFGVRGIRAFNALKNKGSANLRVLIDQIEGASEGIGAAQRQAEQRLDNLAGAFTKLKSATEGVLIEIGALFAKFFRKPIEQAAELISGFAQAFQIAGGQISSTSKAGQLFFKQFGPERGQKLIDFVTGFTEGFQEAKTTIVSVFKTVANAFLSFRKESGMSTADIGKLVAKVLTFGAVIAPIMGAVIAGLFVLGPVLTGIGGAITIVTSGIGILLNILGIVGGVLGAVFSGIAAIVTGIGFIKVAIIAVAAALVGGLIGGFVNLFNKFDEVKTAFTTGFVPGMLAVGKAFADGFLNVLLFPFRKVKQAFLATKSFLGFGGKAEGAVPTPGAPALNRISPEAIPTGLAGKGDASLATAAIGAALEAGSANAAATQKSAVLSPIPQMSVIQETGKGGPSSINANFTIELDGEAIGRKQSEIQLENNERLGIDTSPGERALALRGKSALTRGRVK